MRRNCILCSIFMASTTQKELAQFPVSSGTFCTATFSMTVSDHGQGYFIQPNLGIHTILKHDQEAEGPFGKWICKKFTVYLSSMLIPRYISKCHMMRLMSVKCVEDNFPCWPCFSLSQGGSVTLPTRELKWGSAMPVRASSRGSQIFIGMKITWELWAKSASKASPFPGLPVHMDSNLLGHRGGLQNLLFSRN